MNELNGAKSDEIEPDALWKAELAVDLCLVLVLVSLLFGCSTARKQDLPEAVGPTPLAPGPRLNEGFLVVYTALDGFDALDASHNRHTAYSIYAESGEFVQKVRNRTGPFEGAPLTIGLPPRTYKVVARAVNLGQISIPVVVKEGQTTIVHLDGSTPRGGAAAMVKLPNGQIAGWRAEFGLKH